MKKALVTGGAGFIGGHLVERLVKEGFEVVVVDTFASGRRENLPLDVKVYRMDVESPRLSGVFSKEKPEFVFHFAAQIDVQKSLENPVKDAKVNIIGSLNVLENCKAHAVKKIIFASSGGAIYGNADIIPTPETYPANPVSPYGVAKLAGEHYLAYYQKVFGIPYVALRFANVYGPRQRADGEAGVVSIFAKAMLAGKDPVIFGSGKQTRDFVFVHDAVQACMQAMARPSQGVFNIGTGKEISINEVFETLRKLTGSQIKAHKGAQRQGEVYRSCLNFQKAKKVLVWRPQHSFEQGLKETIEFFRSKRR